MWNEIQGVARNKNGTQLPCTDGKEQKPFRLDEVNTIREVTKFPVPRT
jgi:hypothetical protein